MARTVQDLQAMQQEILGILTQRMNLLVTSADMDLLESGLLDSLAFVDLLFYLEQAFNTTISIENIEIDDFRTAARAAEFVSRHLESAAI